MIWTKVCTCQSDFICLELDTLGTMKHLDLATATVSELSEEFLRLAIAKSRAVMDFDNAKVARLYWKIEAVAKELQRRPGDQRSALSPLYQHPNPGVRLEAASATLVVLPQQSRQVLQMIIDRAEFPFAGDAGMRLHHLATGFFKPT